MMTNHKATSLVFGLAVLLYSAQSLTATDEKQQISRRLLSLSSIAPAPRGCPESRFRNNRSRSMEDTCWVCT